MAIKKTLATLTTIGFLSCTSKGVPIKPMVNIEEGKDRFIVKELPTTTRFSKKKELTIEEKADFVVNSLKEIEEKNRKPGVTRAGYISRKGLTYTFYPEMKCFNPDTKREVLRYHLRQHYKWGFVDVKIRDFKPFGKVDYFLVGIYQKNGPWDSHLFVEKNEGLDKLYTNMIKHSYDEIKLAKKNEKWIERLPLTDDEIKNPAIKRSYENFQHNLDYDKGINIDAAPSTYYFRLLPYLCQVL